MFAHLRSLHVDVLFCFHFVYFPLWAHVPICYVCVCACLCKFVICASASKCIDFEFRIGRYVLFSVASMKFIRLRMSVCARMCVFVCKILPISHAEPFSLFYMYTFLMPNAMFAIRWLYVPHLRWTITLDAYL